MTYRSASRRPTKAASVLLAVLLALSCASTPERPPTARPTVSAPAAGSDPWTAALLKMPFPYLLPLPPQNHSPIDGTYTKVELKDTPPVHCLRCPDYAPEGGVWKLQLDRGVFRIVHQVTGWLSIGSFVATRDLTTAGAPDQLLLFNDPTCPGAVGLYTWRLGEDSLVLQVVDDTCAIHLRAMNLTNHPWLSCQPPNIEAGITDHWPKPPGCD